MFFVFYVMLLGLLRKFANDIVSYKDVSSSDRTANLGLTRICGTSNPISVLTI